MKLAISITPMEMYIIMSNPNLTPFIMQTVDGGVYFNASEFRKRKVKPEGVETVRQLYNFAFTCGSEETYELCVSQHKEES